MLDLVTTPPTAFQSIQSLWTAALRGKPKWSTVMEAARNTNYDSARCLARKSNEAMHGAQARRQVQKTESKHA
jgi:hypothetical protein